jgi:glyoxylate/hydroxypyruvate reductase A
MFMSVIVFVSNLSDEEQQQWLTLLTQYLPDENILLPNQISSTQALSVELAIVANPDPKVLLSYPNLLWMHSLWAGVEHLVKEFNGHNIKLVRLTDPQLAQTMAEACLAWTLYLHRNMPEYTQQQRDKNWQQLPCAVARDVRVSILGAGKLGLAAIEQLKQVGYNVSCWSKTEKSIADVTSYTSELGLKKLLTKTDILINLLPLTQQNVKLLNQEKLSLLPKGAKLINFSRGGVIDTNALLALLKTGHLAHAVLDVFEREPLPTESELWHHPHITILPHISAPTNIKTASKLVADNIINYRQTGNIPNSVDFTLGY